ncbi:hypothetical protein FF098_000190 [Parvularcula flava]|uniref:Flagellar motor switch protein FliM n=2 Tax=Aquisalinus luteolus TaxID=1566827 RepID=A0A8J3ENW3_9PROT|nr:FliM/FliN family flagellar motor switch protein [Aquisalinus luteolus]NHK26320.1 hypothetical protein [Aquisalinus luteolus]GGH91974.1 hypothetical protein GCM10011355_00380 [Aquisalinus luteolus]
MGSILRQKLTAQPAVTDETKGLQPLWDGFARLVTRRLEEEEIGAVMVKSISSRRVTFEEYRTGNDGAQAVFLMASKNVPAACIGHVSRELSAIILGHKTGDDSLSGEDAQSHEPGMLDVLLLQPIMTALFDGFKQSCDGLEKASPFSGAAYRNGMTRLSAIAIEDEKAPLLALTFDLTIGLDKSAPMTFLMPYQPIEKLSILLANAPSKSVDDPEDPWPPHMLSAAMSARVQLRAVLERCPMTIAECARLEVGQVIPLPGVSLNELCLAAWADQGHLPVATAALGVMKQFKAVKLMSDPCEEFIADFANAS